MDNLELNCNVHRSEFIEIKEAIPYNGEDGINIRFVNSKSGETQGVVLNRSQVCKIIKSLIEWDQSKPLKYEKV